MALDVIPALTKQLMAIPSEKKEADLLIVSNGGDANVSWRMMSMLRERFTKVGALLPFTAFSAATLLALGADEIVMHPFSNLGPVDPQLSYTRRIPGPPGSQDIVERIQFGSEDLRHYLSFIREDVGISDQEQLERAFEIVGKEVGAIPIGVAKRAAQMALSLGEQLLSLHMAEQSKVRAIAEALNRSFYHHGYSLGRTEARQIGLPVKEPDEMLEKLMWQVWEDISEEMECNTPFNPLTVVLNDQEAADKLLSPVPQINIPANLPPNLLQKVYNQVLQQIKIISVNPVKFELFLASMESVVYNSQYRARGQILARRLPDMQIKLNTVQISQEWLFNS